MGHRVGVDMVISCIGMAMGIYRHTDRRKREQKGTRIHRGTVAIDGCQR
jgi:hypothetical protein